MYPSSETGPGHHGRPGLLAAPAVGSDSKFDNVPAATPLLAMEDAFVWARTVKRGKRKAILHIYLFNLFGIYIQNPLSSEIVGDTCLFERAWHFFCLFLLFSLAARAIATVTARQLTIMNEYVLLISLLFLLLGLLCNVHL